MCVCVGVCERDGEMQSETAMCMLLRREKREGSGRERERKIEREPEAVLPFSSGGEEGK